MHARRWPGRKQPSSRPSEGNYPTVNVVEDAHGGVIVIQTNRSAGARRPAPADTGNVCVSSGERERGPPMGLVDVGAGQSPCGLAQKMALAPVDAEVAK